MRARRLGVNIFFDMIIALAIPVGITEFGSKSRLDYRQARRNLDSLKELGLIKIDEKTEKFQLTDDGVIIFKVFNKIRMEKINV